MLILLNMTKPLIKKLLSVIFLMVGKIYSYKLGQRLICCRDVIYTMWIRNFMGEIPLDSSIAYPCSLQGGGQKNIIIGHHSAIQSHCIIGCWEKYGKKQLFNPSIVIGDYCSIGEYNHITACNKVLIGNGLLTGRFVYIGDNSHGGLSWEEADIPPVKRHLQSKGEIIIGNNVWIGDKVTILGGVTIGDNVIIGAGSIVTHDVPSNCMAAGMPAKVIKQLD